MAGLIIELAPQGAQTERNLQRWSELLLDPALAKVEGRIETDRHGQIIMSPPPRPDHGRLQLKVGALLQSLLADGEAMTECPISTADGVKAADVAWASSRTMEILGARGCFPRSPEICVEIMSPRNSEEEIREKMRLYFDAGAEEVWVCSELGLVRFYGTDLAPLARSARCPDFPNRIALRPH